MATALSGPRYLVIGGAGLVGSHLLRALQGRDTSVTHYRTVVPDAAPLDITDRAAVHERIDATRPDVILLAAAERSVERCEREPAVTRAANVDATRVVAEAAVRIGATLVVFSSEYVFDGTRGEYSEDDPVAPLNEYGRQKAEIEAIARTAGAHLICRTSGVVGREHGRESFVVQFADALAAGRPFAVPSDQVITPTDAVSLGGAVVELLDRGFQGTFHVVGPRILPRMEYARRIAQAFGLDTKLLRAVPTAELGLAARRPLGAGLRDGKLRTALGHGLRPIDEALRELALEATR